MSDHAGAVFYLQPQIVTAGNFFFLYLAVENFTGRESGDALTAVVGEVEGCIGDVGDHCAGGGLSAGTSAVEKGLPDGVAFHHNAVENVIDIGEQSGFGDECGVDTHLDFAVIIFDDAEQEFEIFENEF